MSSQDNCGNPWKLERFIKGNAIEVEPELSNVDNVMLNKRDLKIVGQSFVAVEYSVIYSESYEVPVMYFCLSDKGR